jgi:formylmethanofuran dehydrogenase subunit E
MPKYTFTRSAIIQETYVIEAETEAEATAIIHETPDQPVVDSEFLDWYTDYFVCEDGDTVCEDCLSSIPKEKSVVTTAGRIVCGECADNTI